MLAAAPALEHIGLVGNSEDLPYYSTSDKKFIFLRKVFPLDVWTRLHHFQLSRFPVHQADLISCLKALPNTLRSVELSFLLFLEGNFRDLVAEIRNKLEWHKRRVEERPRVRIGLRYTPHTQRRGIWADIPVNRFLYHDGPNPFLATGWGNNIPLNCGGIVKDTLDPTFERPWADHRTLAKLGYLTDVRPMWCRTP